MVQNITKPCRDIQHLIFWYILLNPNTYDRLQKPGSNQLKVLGKVVLFTLISLNSVFFFSLLKTTQ